MLLEDADDDRVIGLVLPVPADDESPSAALGEADRLRTQLRGAPLIPSNVRVGDATKDGVALDIGSGGEDSGIEGYGFTKKQKGGFMAPPVMARSASYLLQAEGLEAEWERPVERLSAAMRIRRTAACGPASGVVPYVPRTPIGLTPGIIVVPVNKDAASFEGLAGCYVVVAGCYGGVAAVSMAGDAHDDLQGIGGPGGLQAATGIGVIGQVVRRDGSVSAGAGNKRVHVMVRAGGALNGCMEVCVPIGRLGLLVSPYGAVTVGRAETEARSAVLGALRKADDAAAAAAGRRALGALLAGWPSRMHFNAKLIGGRKVILQTLKFVVGSGGVLKSNRLALNAMIPQENATTPESGATAAGGAAAGGGGEGAASGAGRQQNDATDDRAEDHVEEPDVVSVNRHQGVRSLMQALTYRLRKCVQEDIDPPTWAGHEWTCGECTTRNSGGPDGAVDVCDTCFAPRPELPNRDVEAT